MRQIRDRDTKPELVVRSLIHRMGFRYRLHHQGLPCKPDIVLVSRGKIIDVRGCFFHQHMGCIDGRIPQSRREYWFPKLMNNVQRDASNLRAWRKLGWSVLIVWECEIKRLPRLLRKLARFVAE